MSTSRLILLFLFWALASVAIAVVTAIVGTEILRVVGVVESGSSSYDLAINAIFVVVFAVLVAIPLVLRRHFAMRESGRS